MHDRLHSEPRGDVVNFAVGLDRREECLVVRVEGELDLASAPEFEAALSTAESAPHVVIDLSACPFLDSAGMRVIAEAIRNAPRASIVATDPGVCACSRSHPWTRWSPSTHRSRKRSEPRARRIGQSLGLGLVDGEDAVEHRDLEDPAHLGRETTSRI